MKVMIFWVLTPLSDVVGSQSSRGPCCQRQRHPEM